MDPRLRALADLSVPAVREEAGRHEYDGVVQDLSPAGVRAGLDRLGGPALPDPHDEAHLAAFEGGARVAYGELELHRRNPLVHVANLDLACYDRDYAPAQERAHARQQHLRAWPDAVDAALEGLDAVPQDVARGLLSSVRGLAAGVHDEAALAAHARLLRHVEQAAEHGDPDPALGATQLARLMGVPEALEVDLGALAPGGRLRARPPAGGARRGVRADRSRPAGGADPAGARGRPPGRGRGAGRGPRADRGGRGVVRARPASSPTATASASSARRRSRGRARWR